MNNINGIKQSEGEFYITTYEYTRIGTFEVK